MDYTYPNPLIPGTLIKRYKRFLADITLEDGTVVTAHCANTGSMKGCSDPESPVFLSPATNPKRKLRYSLEIVDVGSSLVGVNTALPNGVVESALKRGFLDTIQGYSAFRREVKYGTNSRIDLLLEGEGLPPCYVEVKNVTLKDGEIARFPDAVSERGRKHLVELQNEVLAGNRAAMCYLIQRTDCTSFSPAREIDPAYAAALKEATSHGVEAYALRATVTPEGIRVTDSLPVDIEG